MFFKRHKSVLATVCVLPLLASCTGDEGPSDPTTTPDQTGEVAPTTDTSTTTDDAAQTTEAATGSVVSANLPAVECEREPVREPSELEASLLVEPGPFAGDDFDLDQVVAAVQAQDPGDPQSWLNAIVNEIHGDYAEGVCHNLAFSTDFDDAGAGPTAGVPPEEEAVGQNHFAVVLDASGSMAEASGSGTRMDAAKDAIATFAEDLPPGSTLSLRIYGHGGSNTSEGKAESCESSEVVFEGGADDAGLNEALGEVEPVGYTPLAKAIGDSVEDIPEDSSDAIVYVVTDGLETCGGDPVQAATDLAAAGVEPVVNVIGFDIGNADQQALRDIASAGGGEYTSVDSGQALEEYWKEEYARMQLAWIQWRDQELKRIRDESSTRATTGFEVENALKATSNTERAQVQEVIRALRDSGDLDRGDALEVDSLGVDRGQEIYLYAGNTRAGDFSDLFVSRQEYLTGIEELGTQKWTEYYRQAEGD
ncbi:vWA domain-containing protein [Ornithinimicrobium sp. Y1694]|uniref:vWA domain-containing protein n=1 Tax=Ornithinimicrobium sp. Y1694 TaxID=3418590 RepID=UPI003CF00F22